MMDLAKVCKLILQTLFVKFELVAISNLVVVVVLMPPGAAAKAEKAIDPFELFPGVIWLVDWLISWLID